MDGGNDQLVFSDTNLVNEVMTHDYPQNIFNQKSENNDKMNINDNHYMEDEPYSAPVEILSEFLSTLMARNYKSALYYCKLILLYEPENEIVQGFYPLIKEKMQLDNFDSDDSDENSSTKSGSSTEYFSSTSVGTEDMSSSSSFSSEEENECKD